MNTIKFVNKVNIILDLSIDLAEAFNSIVEIRIETEIRGIKKFSMD